jgi:nicotinamidase-related amidase
LASGVTENLALILLDMAVGYRWQPGGFGYDMVARVRRLKDAAHAAGVPVIHVHSLRRPTDNVGNSNMMAGGAGLAVIPELQPVDQDVQIYKRYLSGFSHNDLDYTLRTMGVQSVLIAGASTDNTVLWTAADAHQFRYNVTVVEDCTMVHREEEPPGAQEGAIRIMRNVLRAEILSLDETIAKYLTP